MMLYCLCGRHQRALPSGLPAGPALHPLGSLTPDPQLLTQLPSAAAGIDAFTPLTALCRARQKAGGPGGKVHSTYVNEYHFSNRLQVL